MRWWGQCDDCLSWNSPEFLNARSKSHRLLILLNTPPLNRYENGEAFDIVFNVVTPVGGIVYHTVGDNSLAFKEEAKFAGSGAPFAFECYSRNRCVKKSIESAMNDDLCTGGTVVFVELSTGNHNLNGHTATLADAESALLSKGTVMNHKTKDTYNYSEFVAKQAATGSKLKSSASLSAPTGAPAYIWSEQEKAELMKAFKLVVGLESKAENDH